MARTTRSSAAILPEKDSKDFASTPPKHTTKKRKRNPTQESEDQPAQKSSRTDSPESVAPDQHVQDDVQNDYEPLPSAADTPINADDAERILTILEATDSQGMLDREFPLPDDSQNITLRALLTNPPSHPLSTVRAAIQHLLPISAHPRSRRSSAGNQQLHFCQLALSLLDQASFGSVDASLDLRALFSPEGATPSSTHDVSLRKQKYALMQSLPTGTWWTSVNSDLVSLSAQTSKLTELATGYASLVAIVPTPLPKPTESPPTLGSYNHPRPTVSNLSRLLRGNRTLTCGYFVDYGPSASFAPTYDSRGREVGRNRLAECIWARERRRRDKGQRGRIIVEEIRALSPEIAEETVEEEEPKEQLDANQVLQDLLPAEDIASLQSVLDSLKLEEDVSVALKKNQHALQRLEELQYERFSRSGPESTPMEISSEERELANQIMVSLELLASLRPRSSTQSEDSAPLIPPPAVLRTLQASIPTEASPGWSGTLPPSNPSAILDDTTLKIQAPASTPVATTPIATNTPIAANYGGYQYAGYSQHYRPATYTPYKANTPFAYYPNAYANATLPKSAQNYYNQSTGASTPTQNAYYPSLYGYAAMNGATGTPQFNATYAGAVPTQTPQRTAAVANTVKAYTPTASTVGYYNNGYK